MHEIYEITPVSAIVFSLVLLFGITAFLTGLMMAVFSSEKTRAMGFLQMIFGWVALFILYMFLWNPGFFWQMIGAIIGGVIGIGIALGLLLFLLMRT